MADRIRADALGNSYVEKDLGSGKYAPAMVPVDAAGNVLSNAGGGATTIADGSDIAEGATTDVANTTGTTGTLSGKLRGLVTILAATFSATAAAAPARAAQIGTSAAGSTPAVATAGNLVALLADLLGKAVVLPYALGDMLVSGVVQNLATNASTQILAAPAAGLRNYVTSLQIVNEHASVDTDVQLLDGNAGTVIWQGFLLHAGGKDDATLPAPLKQPTTATRLDVKCVTTGANVSANVQGYKAP